MKYCNPVISGFNPDPSICRVGEDYYLVTSTFEYYPGVPVYHSRNLVQWEIIGYCLDRPSQLNLLGCGPSKGIYAPTIRYHSGLFYMITTTVNTYGNFLVYAKDPAGPWSEPVAIDPDGIDPSLFWNDDGTCYYCSTGSVNGVHAIVGFIIDPMTGEHLSEKKILTTGMGRKCTEAPHIYKINGMYYLMTAEGGTEYTHHENIFRSNCVWGPYEPCPHNPILSHIGRAGQLQATGHADLVEDQNGNWWAVCLAIRNFGRCPQHNLGRETFLAPVSWSQDGWPMIGDRGFIDFEMEGPLPAPIEPQQKDFCPDFFKEKPDLRWQFIRIYQAERYEQSNGILTMYGSAETISTPNGSPTMMCVRQPEFETTTCVTVVLDDTNARRAGVSAFYNHAYHYDLYVSDGCVGFSKQVHDTFQEVYRIPLEVDRAEVTLQICSDREGYRAYYQDGSGNWILVGSGHNAGLSTENTMMKTFTGTLIGLFAEEGKVAFKDFSLK